MKRLTVLSAAAAAAVAVLTGCSDGGLTKPRLERSLTTTFANLYVVQQQREGHPSPAAADLQARTSCQKGTQASRQAGPGDDWVCAVTFLVAGPATPVTATYDVTLQTDGCYAADGDGPQSLVGYRTVTAADGTQVRNPLRLVDGCFDPR